MARAVSGKYGQIYLCTIAGGFDYDGSTPPTLTAGAELVECTGWTLDRKVAAHRYASNTSNGYKRAVAGVKSADGTAKGMYDPADAFWSKIAEGTDIWLRLYVDPDRFFMVRAMVESLKINEDFNEGDVVSWDMSFVSNGRWFDSSDSTSASDLGASIP